MLIYAFGKNEATILRLPTTINGNYWLKNKNINGESNNLVNIEAKDNKWIIKSNEDAMISFNGNFVSSAFVEPFNVYVVKTANEIIYIYAIPSDNMILAKYNITNKNQITIGKNNNCDIFYQDNLISDVHAKITYSNDNWIIESYDERFGIYLNNIKVKSKVLKPGDIITILGLKIVFMNSFIAINNPRGAIRLNGNVFSQKVDNVEINKQIKENPYLELYNDDDFFEKSPRFITKFERKIVSIDDPPPKSEDEEMPLLLTIGPMITMGMFSMVMVWSSIDSMVNNKGNMASTIPSIVIAVSMLLSIILWPTLTSRYNKKKKAKKEKIRQEEYRKYLKVKNNEIELLLNQQRQIMLDNNVSLEDCQNIILNKKRNLWEKEIDHEDFLSVRLGIGTIKPDIEIQYPEEHFTLIQDNLKEILESTVSRNKMVKNVPVKISLALKNKTVILGDRTLVNPFLESIFIQLMTFHSYRDLKIVFLSSYEDNNFDYLKNSPYVFSDNNEIRFYGTNIEDNKQICNYLLQVFNSRKYVNEDEINEADYRRYPCYYLILVNDSNAIKNIALFDAILESPINYGFTILLCNNSISKLHNEFSSFININGDYGKTSGYFENELISDKQQVFVADLNVKGRVDIHLCTSKLAGIPIKNIDGKTFEMPKNFSFLEMYNVGKVEQLNSNYRWQTNDPTISLKVPIGVDEFGETFNLDIHEKTHGPHGLIAGITGSGKSELIITYILSLAVNFHPNEVSFVLIDYKGGGLAGAFENRETGLKLPHLAGTITNLDIADMNRALTSIQSELRRRQKIFNSARDELGESTIDIYKYQRLYREGKVKIPVSHLLVISDEFAELKDQQPDFMDQLISTARIGRSLGVHLILATQKPSGVVNDQIWSNSRFRICLKVQDSSDSTDMIKSPLAAMIKDVGRFYLQVGYNEYFALGQSAWSGSPYYPQEKRQKKVSTSIDFINNIGTIIKSVTQQEDTKVAKAQGGELNNVLNYLVNLAKEQSIKVDKLWYDKLPEEIIVSNLIKKYEYKATPKIINPIIGEFDDPNNQRQGLLTLPLSEKGNTIIYGMGGSGKEELLTTLIYSTILYHTTEEVNFYILDFGSETLNIFKNAPQVGDVATSDDKEKIENLFKLLVTIIEQRKAILSPYNGDFNLYNKQSENPLPTIILIINNYDAFLETYDDINDILTTITRDCIRYGIIVILTVSTISSVRYRLSQNFSQQLTLQLSDSYDYSTVVGKTNGLVPASILGRGLIRIDEPYEFQTAYACKKENITSFLREFCNNLKAKIKNKALKIPVLPEKVTVKLFENKSETLSNVPIGVYKDSLGVARYNFKNKPLTIITGLSEEALLSFTKPLIKMLFNVENNKLIITAPSGIFENLDKYELYTNDFNILINNLEEYSEKLIDLYNKNNGNINVLSTYKDTTCIIYGVDNFFKQLTPEGETKFETILKTQEKIKKITFVLIDTSSEIKSQDYTPWYTTLNFNNGIWVGSGLYNQFLLTASIVPPEAKEEIEDNLGFIIDKSQAKTIKLLEEEQDE